MNHETFGSMIRVAREGSIAVVTAVALLAGSTAAATTVPLPAPAGGTTATRSSPAVGSPSPGGVTGVMGVLGSILALFGWGAVSGDSGTGGINAGLGGGVLSSVSGLWNDLQQAWNNGDVGGVLSSLAGFLLLGAGLYGMLMPSAGNNTGRTSPTARSPLLTPAAAAGGGPSGEHGQTR